MPGAEGATALGTSQAHRTARDWFSGKQPGALVSLMYALSVWRAFSEWKTKGNELKTREAD